MNIDITKDIKKILESIEEDYIVQNKNTGNVYSVKNFNSDTQIAVDKDEKGNPIERSPDEAEAKSREIHKEKSTQSKAEKDTKEKEDKKAAINRALKSATENAKGELDHMTNTIFKDKNNPFHIDIKSAVKKMKKVSNKPVTKESVDTLKHNGKVLIEEANKKGALSKEDITYLDDMNNLLCSTAADSGLTEKHMNRLLVDSISKVLFQEDESRKHQLGDHGIRHIYGNMKYTQQALTKLDSKVKTTQRQKFLAQMIMVSHDLGYATSEARKPGMDGINASNAHKDVSGILIEHEINNGLWKDMNLTEDEKKFVIHAIKTHDAAEMDFDNEPVLSSIRLSDNIAVFKKEKIPYAFKMLGDEKSKGSLTQLRLINQSSEKIEKEITQKYLNNEISGEQYNNKLVALKQMQKKKQNAIKDSLKQFVNENTQYKDFEKKAILNAIDEISPFTAKVTPGMWSGQIREQDGINFEDNEEGKTRASVHIEHNKFNEQLNSAGFNLGNNKFLKMAESFGIEAPKKPKPITKEQLNNLNQKEKEKLLAENFKSVQEYNNKKQKYDESLSKGELINPTFKVKVEQMKNEAINNLRKKIIEDIIKSTPLVVTTTLQFINDETMLDAYSKLKARNINSNIVNHNTLSITSDIYTIDKLKNNLKGYLQ